MRKCKLLTPSDQSHMYALKDWSKKVLLYRKENYKIVEFELNC